MRVFLDANILFSASKKDSLLALLLVSLKNKKVHFISNLYAVDEARRNLQIHYPERISLFEKQISKIEISALLKSNSPLDKKLAIKDKDLPIMLGAIATKCDFLVTGDKRDFGHLFGEVINGTTVVTPRMLADKLGIK